jgi:hypothetical protein
VVVGVVGLFLDFFLSHHPLLPAACNYLLNKKIIVFFEQVYG